MNGTNNPLEEYKIIPHYHGDIVRILFLIGGALMLVSYPFIMSFVPVPLVISILLILSLVIVAGFTNPKQTWTAILDFSISVIGFAIFEYEAISNMSADLLYATINQILAIIFFIAIYFSAKTLRGFLLRGRH